MTALITSLGVAGVFVLMVPESACIPIPSEVTLLFSGFAVSNGWLSYPLVIVAATAGNLAGSLIAYGVGASGLVQRVPGARNVLARGEAVLDRHGPRAVFVARLLPLARTFVSLPAGARHVALGRFVALTTAGCALWALAFVTAGALAGSAWLAVSSIAGRVLLVGGIAVLAVALLRRPRAGGSQAARSR
jgi:membrane protein DedA with SNARE-associated domain